MRRVPAILLTLGLLAAACNPQTPDTPDKPVNKPDSTVTPGPEPPKPKEVTLMSSFTEEFSSRTPEFFSFSYREVREDFRYFSAFPSLSEKNKTILMLRVDPADAAGAGRGATLTSSGYTWYGSYSARIRIPDIVAVQPNAGICADLTLSDDDPVWGLDEITLSLRLADQKNIYARTSRREAGSSADASVEQSVSAPGISSFNSASGFYIYGMDWTEEKIVWWVQASASAGKTVIAERTEGVPTQPLRLVFRYYHSKLYPAQDKPSATQAPLYPFELEIDWIAYTPFQQ